jgi:hypothetical protein
MVGTDIGFLLYWVETVFGVISVGGGQRWGTGIFLAWWAPNLRLLLFPVAALLLVRPGRERP